MVTRAKEEGRALLEQVQEARRRSWPTSRRGGVPLSMQIEQLRGARDEMAASVHGVRDKVDGILDQLDRSEDQARAAALAVGDQIRLHGQDEAERRARRRGHGGGDRRWRVEGGTDVVDAPTDPGVRRAPRPRSTSSSPGSAPGPTPTRRAPGPAAPPRRTPRPRRQPRSPATDAGAVDAAEAPDAPDAVLGEESAVPAGPDAEIIARRDELLTPIAAKLNRTVKRTLGDDQNRMLDLLRSTPSIDAEGLLGPEDAHLALFADAVQDQLGEAYAAGAIVRRERRRRACRGATRWTRPRRDWPGPWWPCCAGASRTAARSPGRGSARPSANGGASGSSAWPATRRRTRSRPAWRPPRRTGRTARCAGW